MNGLSVRRKPQIARAYAAFFVAASFFIEGTMAAQNANVGRQVLSPGPANFLHFTTVSNAITCEPLSFSWTLVGDSSSVAFYASNVDVTQAPPPSLTTSSTRHNTGTDGGNVARSVPTGVDIPTQLVTVTVENDVLPSKEQYSWSSVDIPQGWYQLIASLLFSESTAPSNFTSPTFFVYNGSDTSCVLSSSPSNTATLSNTATSSNTATTQTGSQPTSAGLSTSSTPTPTIALPVGGASTSSTNTRLIVGVTIGVVVLVAAALGAWFWLYPMRRKSKGARGSSHVPRRWNGLGSTDSRGGFMGDASSRQQHTGSMGTIPMSPSEEAVLKAEKHSVHSKFGDGSPFDDGPGLALATVPVLQQPQARFNIAGVARTYSTSSSISNGRSPNEFGAVAPPGRRPSVPDSLMGRQSMESAAGYPPSSPSSPSSGMGGRSSTLFIPAPALSRSHSLSTSATHQTSMMGGHTGFLPGGSSQSTSSHAGLLYQTSRHTPSPQPEINSPTSPSTPTATVADAATKQANRRSLGGTKRKPVPVYTADDEPGGSSTPPMPSLSSTPIPPPSPVADHAPHYITRSQAGQDLSQPQLVHKSSFGPAGIEGKPLHYLMPDMPMPLKD